MKTTYILATETPEGAIVTLDLGPMTKTRAMQHRDKLAAISPYPVFVLNLEAI